MKILFGGTFDPVHNGHIHLARYISELLEHKVSFLPLSGVPNYKSPPIASLQQRLAMLEIVCDKYSQYFTIDYNEANLVEYSPTVSTLRRLRKIYGEEEPFYFIIGGDSLISLDIWDEWQELFSLTNFVVAMRPDYPLSSMSSELAQQVTSRITYDVKQAKNPKEAILITHFTPTNISSTEIRKLIQSNTAIENLIDHDVRSYIETQQLYK